MLPPSSLSIKFSEITFKSPKSSKSSIVEIRSLFFRFFFSAFVSIKRIMYSSSYACRSSSSCVRFRSPMFCLSSGRSNSSSRISLTKEEAAAFLRAFSRFSLSLSVSFSFAVNSTVANRAGRYTSSSSDCSSFLATNCFGSGLKERGSLEESVLGPTEASLSNFSTWYFSFWSIDLVLSRIVRIVPSCLMTGWSLTLWPWALSNK
mmetsp:Transcript_4711/g.9073  ORF Transcript_4711/g.9073 Transcript_4711/m.9073 type:complete len:205 (+) Transcript_4711:471-1085(+)